MGNLEIKLMAFKHLEKMLVKHAKFSNDVDFIFFNKIDSQLVKKCLKHLDIDFDERYYEHFIADEIEQLEYESGIKIIGFSVDSRDFNDKFLHIYFSLKAGHLN